MQVLLMLFVGAVLVLGRWRGLGALAGLGASMMLCSNTINATIYEIDATSQLVP